MRSIRIASRASKLALIQSGYIGKLLQDICPGVEIAIVTVSTKGDRDKSDFLHKSESVGFFTSEVEKFLLEGKADIAVHSLKDLPTAIREGLVIAAIPQRESPADAFIAASGITSIETLCSGATVGTSSLRRMAQLKRMRSDLNCVPLRGNVETRVNKVVCGKIDAAILACAGLNRLGLADKISQVLSPDDFVPAPGQGALAVQTRCDDEKIIRLVSRLDDTNTRIAVEAERSILAVLQGGCSIPLGVYAQIAGDVITIYAMLSDVEAEKYITLSRTGPITDRKALVEIVVKELLEAGGGEILEQLKNFRS
ncbi:MAG: hydroxymethylbilane synthase [Phycisphaerae bacterium]|nr:hydroxymethylbilane synthase [Phycisphaerae bacterium]